MAVEINSKKPQAEPGWYSTETANGLDYLEVKASTKFGNPGGDALIAQGYKYVGKEDPRLSEKKAEEEETEVKDSKAKK